MLARIHKAEAETGALETFSTLTLTVTCALALTGCQSLAIAMNDDPTPYGSGPAGYNCAAQMQDAAVWGTLPSAYCAPANTPFFWWPRRTGVAPYYYGRPYGPAWRGPGYYHRGFYRGGGGFRGGRGGRR